MREILFRGKRVDNGEWVEGFYIEANHHWHNKGIHKEWIVTNTFQNGGWCNVASKYAVIPETVGQYTGLVDKNGKRIFEGDIVKVADDDGNIDCCDCGVGEVIFCVGMWYVAGDVNNSLYDINNVFYIEVIGNIHDNPEGVR